MLYRPWAWVIPRSTFFLVWQLQVPEPLGLQRKLLVTSVTKQQGCLVGTFYIFFASLCYDPALHGVGCITDLIHTWRKKVCGASLAALIFSRFVPPQIWFKIKRTLLHRAHECLWILSLFLYEKGCQTCFAMRLDMPAYVNRGLEPIQEDLWWSIWHEVAVPRVVRMPAYLLDMHIFIRKQACNREFLVHSMSSNKTMLGNSEVQEDNVFQFQARTWQHALPRQKGYLSACRVHASFTCPLYSLTIPEVFALPKTLKTGMVPPFHYHYLAWKVPPYTIPGSHKKLPVDSGIHLGSSKSMGKTNSPWNAPFCCFLNTLAASRTWSISL